MTRKKITFSTVIATALVAGLAAYFEADEFAPTPSDPTLPIVVWACCSVNGCEEVDGPSDCPASDDLIACCGPASAPDGSVECGCAATKIERKPVVVSE